MALAALLSLVVAHPAAVGAVLLAGIAILQRWGTPSLEAIAGAQSVLGAGGAVGPQAAAASAWFAAIALVLATPRPAGDDGAGPTPESGVTRRRPGGGTLAAALALGAAAGAAVAGPDFGDDLLLRLGATAAAVFLAVVVSSLRRQDVTAVLALVAGIVAAALATGVASGRVGL